VNNPTTVWFTRPQVKSISD